MSIRGRWISLSIVKVYPIVILIVKVYFQKNWKNMVNLTQTSNPSLHTSIPKSMSLDHRTNLEDLLEIYFLLLKQFIISVLPKLVLIKTRLIPVWHHLSISNTYCSIIFRYFCIIQVINYGDYSKSYQN